MMTADRPWLNAAAAGPATSLLSVWITEGSRTEAAMWPCRMSDTAPVWPTQYLVLPAPPVDGPVTQLDVPAGPPAPAWATHRPSDVRVRCRGLLSPLRTTLTEGPGDAPAAAAGMATPAATPAARTAAAKRCIVAPPQYESRRFGAARRTGQAAASGDQAVQTAPRADGQSIGISMAHWKVAAILLGATSTSSPYDLRAVPTPRAHSARAYGASPHRLSR